MSKKAVEKDKKRTKIMVFGTFDGLHPGHLNFFKQARDLALDPFLIVSVARDKNVFKIKGRKPRMDEKKRAAMLRKSGLADKVVLSGLREHIPHIAKERPDVLALGYDQRAYVKDLEKELEKKNMRTRIVRLKPYKEKIYKNALLRPRPEAS